LLVAFFPRNERRLFTWPLGRSIGATISAPVQTSLRSGIFEPLVPAGQGDGELRHKPRPEDKINFFKPEGNEPLLDAFGPDSLPFADNPLTFGFPMPGLDFMPGPQTGPFINPGRFPGIPPALFGGGDSGCTSNCGGNPPPPPPISGVPEISTWAMMIFGIGVVGACMRTVRYRIQKRRAHRRWREGLLPKPIFEMASLADAAASPVPSGAMASVGGARGWGDGSFTFGLGASQLAYAARAPRKIERNERG
jgi:hypothetical protein